MFSFFRTKRSTEIESFAIKLVDELAKRYPPELDNTPGKLTSVNRLTRILEDSCLSAANFQSEMNLGVYGKAKLANIFKWALTEKKYTKKFVDLATEAIIVHISKGKNAKS